MTNGDDTRQRDIKKSKFVAKTTLDDGSFLDFVIAGQNFKISKADFLAAIGTFGTLEQLGENTAVPVLSKSGTVNRIRNLLGGSGILVSVSPENGIQLDHNFTVNETGAAIMKDKTAASPIFRSIVAGFGISVGASNGSIQIALSGTPTATKTVIINELSDFPNSVAGVRTLADNTDYFLANDITTSDRFVMGDNCVIRGSDSLIIMFEYTGVDNFFTASEASIKFTNINLKCSTGTLFDASCAGVGNGLQMLNATVQECDSIGTIDGYEAFQFSDVFFANVITKGLLLAGTISIATIQNLIISMTAGTAIDLDTAIVDNVSIRGVIANIPSGATFLSGAASSANISTGGLGSVLDSRVFGDGTALDGITIDDLLWEFSLNSGIGNTREEGLISLKGNATETVITTPTVQELILGTWETDGVSKFSGTAAGRLTYIGPKMIKVPITATLTGSPVSGTNIPITYHLFKNGADVGRADQGNTISSTSPKNTTLIWQLELDTDDFLELYVSNDSTTANVLVTDVVFRVN